MTTRPHEDCPLGLTPDAVLKLIQDQAKQTAKLENIETTLDAIRTSLTGNGTNGLMVRTDRLEQKDKVRHRFFWSLFAIVAALLANTIATFFGS